MKELTPVHAAVLAVLVLLLLGLAAVNLMITSESRNSTRHLSGGVIESLVDEDIEQSCYQTDDNTGITRKVLTP